LRPLLRRDDGLKVVLPVVGDYCIPVHKGYKAFDLARGSVFKLFEDKGGREAFRSELVQAVGAGQLAFAPTVRSADEDRLWYEEEYVRGTIGHFLPQMQRRALLVDRTDEFVACLGAISAAANGGAISRERYTHQTARYIRGRCNTVRRESPEAAAAIEAWMNANVAPIYEGTDENLALVF